MLSFQVKIKLSHLVVTQQPDGDCTQKIALGCQIDCNHAQRLAQPLRNVQSFLEPITPGQCLESPDESAVAPSPPPQGTPLPLRPGGGSHDWECRPGDSAQSLVKLAAAQGNQPKHQVRHHLGGPAHPHKTAPEVVFEVTVDPFDGGALLEALRL